MADMTEKEMAEEWVQNNNYPYSNCPNIEKKLKQAYLAGLKAVKDMTEAEQFLREVEE